MPKRFLSHPVMGLYAALLIALTAGCAALALTGHGAAGIVVSQIGTFLIVAGFGLFALFDWIRRGRR